MQKGKSTDKSVERPQVISSNFDFRLIDHGGWFEVAAIDDQLILVQDAERYRSGEGVQYIAYDLTQSQRVPRHFARHSKQPGRSTSFFAFNKAEIDEWLN